MRALSAIAFIVMTATTVPAIAYTQADVDACTPDAMRLCMDAVPDKRRVALCLFKNKQQLGLACAAVFDRARAVNASGQRPARVQETQF